MIEPEGDLPPELERLVADAVERMRAEQEAVDRVTLLAVEVATRDLREEIERLRDQLADAAGDAIASRKREHDLQERLDLAVVEIRALTSMVDDAQTSMQNAAREAYRVSAEVTVLRTGWRSAHEMHSRHHWCVDRQERTRPFKIGERCPTLDALESGRAVTP